MTKVVRGESSIFLRDTEGKHTAISFTTKSEANIWISNKAVRTVCYSAIVVVAMLTGTLQSSIAKVQTDVFVSWMLRGSR